MAYAFGLSTTFAGATSASTLTFTSFGSTIPAGTLLTLGWGCTTASRTVSSCSDNSSQSGSANVYVFPLAPIAGATLSGGPIWCYTTRALLTGDTITITLNGTATQRSGLLMTFSGASANTQLDQWAIQNTRTSSPITMGATPAMMESAELAVGISCWKGGNVANGFSATSTGYTGVTGARAGTTTSVQTDGSYNTSVGTAATTSVHTFTSMTAGCGIIMTFRPTATLPTTGVLDSFNSGASQALTARTGWGSGHIDSGDFSFETDATPTVASTAALGTPASNMWGSSLSANQEVFYVLGTLDSVQLVLRAESGTAASISDGYLAVVGFGGSVQLETVGGTTLLNSTIVAPVSTDTFLFQAVGSVMTLWKQKTSGPWTAVMTVTDATWAGAGFIGMRAGSGNTPTINAFGGGGLTAAVVPYQPAFTFGFL